MYNEIEHIPLHNRPVVNFDWCILAYCIMVISMLGIMTGIGVTAQMAWGYDDGVPIPTPISQTWGIIILVASILICIVSTSIVIYLLEYCELPGIEDAAPHPHIRAHRDGDGVVHN